MLSEWGCTAAIFKARSAGGRNSASRWSEANLGEPKEMHRTSARGYVMEAQVAAATEGMLAAALHGTLSRESG